MTIIFSKWEGKDGLKQFIIDKTGCKPFSGAGINLRANKKTALLKSVDDVYYYNDDLTNSDLIKYTLFGHSGNQDENEKKFNAPLLNTSKTKHIFVYRVTPKKSDKYIWYGKYEIIDRVIERHIGEDRKMRNIIVLTLKKLDV